MTQTNLQPNKSTSLHPVIKRLFDKRGFDNKEIEDFLSWDLKKLPDLRDLKDLTKCADRIIKAMENNEIIGIYGDYDVDGTTSCALFHHFFKMHNYHSLELIQPSRFIEGYGLHISSIDKAQEMGIKLLITVDCGITNNDAADYAIEKGLDLIITDHHTDGSDQMPDAYAIVNPNRRDEAKSSQLKVLAGVTVAFCVCLEVKTQIESIKKIQTPSLYPLLQFVAIGTICDLAKLTLVNLKLVRHGLKQMRETEYIGIRSFIPPEERKAKVIPSEKLSFNIGPMINSKGRLDHPEKALELLITNDDQTAFECYNHLDIANKERKFIQSEVYEGANKQVLKQLQGSEHLISIVYDESWHEGVIGIVASKLVENFKVPAIVFTNAEQKGIIKASARSAGDLSIFNCLQQCKDLFTKFGGHKAAAGLSMPQENLKTFIEKMNKILAEIPTIERTTQDYFDLEILPEEINPRLLKELELLEPFGMGNSKPIFKMKNFELISYDLLKDVHVRWNIKSKNNKSVNLKGISFNYIGKYSHQHPEELFRAQKEKGEELCAYFTLGINRFNGNEYIQLMVDRMTVGEFS